MYFKQSMGFWYKQKASPAKYALVSSQISAIVWNTSFKFRESEKADLDSYFIKIFLFQVKSMRNWYDWERFLLHCKCTFNTRFLQNTLLLKTNSLCFKNCQVQSVSIFTLPCGVIVWNGLVGDFTFHMVKVPSEWLQMNCLPSWCQATEWIAYARESRTT